MRLSKSFANFEHAPIMALPDRRTDFESRTIAAMENVQAHSREWNVADQQTGLCQVWYNFTDRMIRDEKHFYRALNYIHVNPIKHKYTDDSYEWLWSSIHIYFETQGREWLREKRQAYPPGDFGKGWDDG